MIYQYNDAGRSLSKTPKQKSDCAIRAVSLITYFPYDCIYSLFKTMGRKNSTGTPKKIWQKYLDSRNSLMKISFPAIKGKARMSLEQFCSPSSEYSNGSYLLQLAGHVTFVKNGVILDTFEPRHNACVYTAWKRI